jgi:hypothetical protein
MGLKGFFSVALIIIIISILSQPVAALSTGNLSVRATTANGDPMSAWVEVQDANGVVVDHGYTSSKTALIKFNIASGTYSVIVKSSRSIPGSNSYIRTDNVAVPPNGEVSTHARFGQIEIKVTTANGDPMWAWAEVNNENGVSVDYGNTPNGLRTINVVPGNHTVTVKSGRHTPSSNSYIQNTVAVPANGKVSVDARFGQI